MSYPKPDEQPPAYRMVNIKMTSWEAVDALHELKNAISEKRVVTSDSRGNVMLAIEAIESALKESYEGQ